MPVETSKLSQSNNKYHHYTTHYSAYYYRRTVLYWLLLFIVFISFISLPFINVDVSIQSRGIVTTQHKISTIISPITAKVIRVNLSENLHVLQGDTLLVLDQSGFSNELIANYHQVELQTSYLHDLDLLLSDVKNSSLTSSLYKQKRLDYLENISNLNRKVSKLQIDFKRTSELYQDGVVSLSAFQEDSFKLYEIKDELRSFKTSKQAQWAGEKRNYTLAIHELNAKIENLKYKKSQCYITAPLNGNVIEFNGIAEGSFLLENQLIARLSPRDDLIVECYVTPADIGFIREGMDVNFQIDAYNYNQWGLLKGVVSSVAYDVTLVDGEHVYVIRSIVNREYMELKNGVKGSLKKGMSLTGRFIVTQRSLFQLLFDNMDDWLNPKVVME